MTGLSRVKGAGVDLPPRGPSSTRRSVLEYLRPLRRGGGRRYSCPVQRGALRSPYRSRSSSRYRPPLLLRELLGEPLECAVLQDPNRSRFLPHDRGHVLRVESADNAEENDLRLVRREACDEVERRLGLARGQRLHLRIRGARSERLLERPEEGSPPRLAPAQVDQTPPRDRKQPTAKAGLVALETAEPRRRIEPDLRGQIVTVGRRLRTEVTQKPRLKLPVQRSNRPLGPRPRCRKHPLERLP